MTQFPQSILCVDDEQSILNALKRTLKNEEYNLFTALSGKEALDILKNNKVDLILSDQRMPEMSGSELLRTVKQNYPHIIRVMISGYSDFDNLVQILNEGEICHFIPKPWDQIDLRKIIKRLLKEKTKNHFFNNILENIKGLSLTSPNTKFHQEKDSFTLSFQTERQQNTENIKRFTELLSCLLKNKETQEISAFKKNLEEIQKEKEMSFTLHISQPSTSSRLIIELKVTP